MPSISPSSSYQNCFVLFTSMCSIYCSNVESRRYLYQVRKQTELSFLIKCLFVHHCVKNHTVIKLFGSTKNVMPPSNNHHDDAFEIGFKRIEKLIKSKYDHLSTQIALLRQQIRHFHQQSTSSHQVNNNQICQSSAEYDSDTTIVDSFTHSPADEIIMANDIFEENNTTTQKEPENNSSPNLEHIDCQQYKCDHPHCNARFRKVNSLRCHISTKHDR